MDDTPKQVRIVFNGQELDKVYALLRDEVRRLSHNTSGWGIEPQQVLFSCIAKVCEAKILTDASLVEPPPKRKRTKPVKAVNSTEGEP